MLALPVADTPHIGHRTRERRSVQDGIVPAYTMPRLKVPWNITLNFLFLRVPEAAAMA